MVKLTREIAHSLRNQGRTFADIAKAFDVSKQYVHALYTGYKYLYQHSDKYRMYKRHQLHKHGSEPIKPCDYCQSPLSQSSTQI